MAVQGGGGGGGGGGGRANDVRAGGGFYELYLKDGVTKTLEKVKLRALTVGAAMGAVGGAFGTVLSRVLEESVGRLSDMVTGAGNFRKQMEESVKATERMVKAAERLSKAREEWMSADPRPAAKMADLDRMIAETKAQLELFRARREGDRRDISRIKGETGVGDAFRGTAMYLTGTYGSTLGAVEKSLDASSAAAERFRERLTELETARKRALDPGTDPAFVGGLRQVVDALEREVETFGMDAAAMAIWDAKRKDLTGTASTFILTMENRLKDLTDAKVRKEFAAWNAELQKFADTAGLTAEQIRLMDFKKAGIDPALIEQTAEMLERMKLPGTIPGVLGAIANVGAQAAVEVSESVRLLNLLSQSAEMVKGGFGASAAGRQFGVGDQTKKQIDLLTEVAGHTADTASRIAALTEALRLK